MLARKPIDGADAMPRPLTRHAHRPTPRPPPRRTRTQAARRVAANRRRLFRRRTHHPHPRPRNPHGADRHDAFRLRSPQGRAAEIRRSRRNTALADARQSARLFSVHRGRVPIPPRERRPDAHVRRRRRSVPHQPPFQAALRRHAGQTPFDRVRFGHALRRRAARAPGHLRQGRQFGRFGRNARRHEGALRRLRSVRAGNVGIDDDQRSRADACSRCSSTSAIDQQIERITQQHRPRARPKDEAGRPPAAQRWKTCAAPCRPTS